MNMTLYTLRLMKRLALGPLTGSQAADELGISVGTIYPILKRLGAANYVKAKWETGTPQQLGRPLRCYYRLTPDGESFLSREMEKLT